MPENATWRLHYTATRRVCDITNSLFNKFSQQVCSPYAALSENSFCQRSVFGRLFARKISQSRVPKDPPKSRYSVSGLFDRELRPAGIALNVYTECSATGVRKFNRRFSKIK